MTDLELVAAQVEEEPTLLVPYTGTIVDLTKPAEVAQALADVRDLESRLYGLRKFLGGVLRLEAQRAGQNTLHFDGLTVEIKGSPKDDYDAELLQERLRDAGMPEERIAEVVVQTVSWKVNRQKLKWAAGANPAYAAAAEDARMRVEQTWSATVKPNTRGKG